MPTTTNYSWTTPADTDLVKDGAAAIRTLGSSADTTVKNLNPGTTAGDIDYYTSGTAKARIGIGTAGQVLQVNSGATAPEWATATSGGLTLISTTTLSSTTVSLTSIPQTYRYLYLVIDRPTSATGGNIDLRWGQGSVNTNTRYIYNGTRQTGGATAVDFTQFGQTQVDLMDGISQSTSQQRMSLQITFPEYTKTNTGKTITWTGYWQSTAGEPYMVGGQAAYDGAFYIDTIDILSTQTLTGGSALLFGGK